MKESRKYFIMKALSDGREVSRAVSFDAKVIGDAVKIALDGMIPVDKIEINVSRETIFKKEDHDDNTRMGIN